MNDACLGHDPGPGHPERIARLEAVAMALGPDSFPGLMRETAPQATSDMLEAVHDSGYVAQLLKLNLPPGESAALDPDTILSSGSVAAALHAAGGACRGVDLVMDQEAEAAFVAVRPPGHHAEPARGMGFCLFNNVATAAHRARDRWGLQRIAVADFDVHHGNGTQAAFWDDPDLFFASSHQSPYYPGTGAASERGCAGNIANAALAAGSGSQAFRRAWERELLPAIDDFAPELLLISAGFDAHRRDPLAQLELETQDFSWITRELKLLANRHCGGRIVSMLEGGYDLTALAQSTAAHVSELGAR